MTAALATTGTTPLVRMRPVPALEPPYEDDPAAVPDHRSAGPYDIELPLDWGQRARTDRHSGPGHRAIAAGQAGTASRRGTAGVRMPDNLAFLIRRFVDMYVEVLNERRPVQHLAPHTTHQTFAAIRLGVARRGRSRWPAGRRPRPYQRPPGTSPSGQVWIRVQRLRSCVPRPGVVEVVAVLRRADEVRSVALRLEREASRWICTALEFVG